MSIEELEQAKEKFAREARKWVPYLESRKDPAQKDPAQKESELTRLLLETYLTGRIGLGR